MLYFLDILSEGYFGSRDIERYLKYVSLKLI